jgi:hypothetical protein
MRWMMLSTYTIRQAMILDFRRCRCVSDSILTIYTHVTHNRRLEKTSKRMRERRTRRNNVRNRRHAGSFSCSFFLTIRSYRKGARSIHHDVRCRSSVYVLDTFIDLTVCDDESLRVTFTIDDDDDGVLNSDGGGRNV